MVRVLWLLACSLLAVSSVVAWFPSPATAGLPFGLWKSWSGGTVAEHKKSHPTDSTAPLANCPVNTDLGRAWSNRFRTKAASSGSTLRTTATVHVNIAKTLYDPTATVLDRIAWRNGFGAPNSLQASPRATTKPQMWRIDGHFATLENRFDRIQQSVFLFATVRDPADRCLSGLYEASTRSGGSVNSQEQLDTLDLCVHDMIDSLRPRATKGMYIDCVPDAILNFYDFVGNMQRPVETFLLLKNMLHLEFVDILYPHYTSANDNIGAIEPNSHWLGKASSKVRFYESTKFRESNRVEYDLIRRVDVRMNELIAAIPDWKEQLAQYTDMLAKVHASCPLTQPCHYHVQDDAGSSCETSFEGCIRASLGSAYETTHRDGISGVAASGNSQRHPGTRTSYAAAIAAIESPAASNTLPMQPIRSVLYMCMQNTKLAGIMPLLEMCRTSVCRTDAGSSYHERRLQRAPAVSGCRESNSAQAQGFLDFNAWSRERSCALTMDSAERTQCRAKGRTGNDSAVLLRFPSTHRELQSFPIVAGRIRFQHIPTWLLRRDVRITVLRDPMAQLFSALLLAYGGSSHGRDSRSSGSDKRSHHIDTMTRIVADALEELDLDNQAYVSQLAWLCSDDLPTFTTKPLGAGSTAAKTDQRSAEIRVVRIISRSRRMQVQDCANQGIAALGHFNVVALLEEPQNTAALLRYHLGDICPWGDHQLLLTQTEEATAIPTNEIMAALPAAKAEKVKNFVRFDQQLYDAAVQYNTKLVEQLGRQRRRSS